MKHRAKQTIVAIFALFVLALTSCDTDFVNPNNPTEDVIFESKEGLFALSIGLNQYFTTTVLRQVIEAPGITTRELGVTNTFLNINELARGSTELPPESGGITNPWVTLLRAKGMAESLIAGVDAIDLAPGTRSGLLAYGNFYKAICLGYLSGMWEQAVINNSPDGDAAFSDRATVLAEAINLLTEARDAINANPISDDFKSSVLGDNFNMLKSVNAFLSRFSLMAGNYNDTITHADAVLNDASAPASSVYNYDANNVNPIWFRINPGASDLKPQTNFGLLGPFVPEPGDGRIAFYLGADAGTANIDAGGQPLSQALGFWTTSTSPIPVYLQGEMLLNKAEAYARLNQLPDAVSNLNLVREKTDDPLGVNAGLAAWTGDVNSQTDILEEIYKNRAIELFLNGTRFEDSRRFHPNLNPAVDNLTNERNRNFYPYPSIERDNNPNTPADPAI
ncbi:MAG: RagB/SusD family nutrient uptake outer membrane protein [bacterium]